MSDSEQEDLDMNGILKKIRQSDIFNRENRVPCIKAVVLMSLFTFTFLGAEFLFVDMISRTVPGDRSVAAQNYALGISVIGFVLYPLICRVCGESRHRPTPEKPNNTSSKRCRKAQTWFFGVFFCGAPVKA